MTIDKAFVRQITDAILISGAIVLAFEAGFALGTLWEAIEANARLGALLAYIRDEGKNDGVL